MVNYNVDSRLPDDCYGLEKNNKRIMLFGDTNGTSTVGLLYLASYLRRNGVEAYCQWNNSNMTCDSIEKNIINVLDKVKPEIVGISMKWFIHMARVLEMCKIIKQYRFDIKLVLGGDTAAYYWEKLIQSDLIDYIVLGDGELPLLYICQQKENIPNCVYKKDGKIIKSPVNYVQDGNNSQDIYLSHLDEIFVDEKDPSMPDYFYIYTGKGCSGNCFFCSGCNEMQKKVFNRKKPFIRNIEEVRNDIILAKKYSKILKFDFDLPGYDLYSYYNELWDGIDLSRHTCLFSFWKLPQNTFVYKISKVFKHVHFSIDICSLSARHRKQLEDLKLVKPQPTDEDLIGFFNKCKEYSNIEISISLIGGLPFYTAEDEKESENMIKLLLGEYPQLKSYICTPLHAEPGAPIIERCKEYGMHSYAGTYEDFLHYSTLNFKQNRHSDMNYPYIVFEDNAAAKRNIKHIIRLNSFGETK